MTPALTPLGRYLFLACLALGLAALLSAGW